MAWMAASSTPIAIENSSPHMHVTFARARECKRLVSTRVHGKLSVRRMRHQASTLAGLQHQLFITVIVKFNRHRH